MTFLLLFNILRFSKTSLFCCNGYSHSIFTYFFYESQVQRLRKSNTKEFFFKFANDFFIAVLLRFYDLKHQNLTKNRLSNQKSGMVLEVTFILNSKMNIITWYIKKYIKIDL